MIVAVDAGYGMTKVVAGGRAWVFPSLVGSWGSERLSGLFPGAEDGVLDALRVEVEGLGTFAVGELALHGASDATRAFEGHGRWEHPSTRVLIDAALVVTLGSAPPAGPLYLATGLPLAFWAGQRQAFAAWLRCLNDRARLVGDSRHGGWIRLSPAEVTVYPQAAGALYDALFDPSGTIRDRAMLEAGGLVGVVDVGYRTTDYLVIDLDRELRVREDLAGTLDLGMVQLDQALQRAFLDATGAVLPPDQLDRARRRGAVVYRGRQVNLAEALRGAGEALARAVADRVKAAWGPQIDYLVRLYLAGGGAEALGEQLLGAFPGAEVMPDAQFTNARGFAAMATVARTAGVRAG